MTAITRLTLTDFRNHAHASINAGHGGGRGGLVVITGDNGAGKTNILDAISLLAPGRGLRGAALSDAARQDGPGGWSVAAHLVSAEGEVQIGTGVAAAAAERRLVRINGAAATATALADWLALVWLTPAMDRLFSESAGSRRRFLDRLILGLHPGHGQRVNRYEAAMRERSRLLAAETPADPVWLAGLETDMAAHGAVIAAARADTVAALAEALADAPEGPFARPLLALAGNDADDLAGRLARGRARDAAAARAIEGPHRADLVVTHAARAMPAASCSTGEQKALLVAIVLAHAALVAQRSGRPPILLLDEIAAHLDGRRRTALFDRLTAMGVQAWMTGTDPALFAGVAGQWLHLAGGQISPAAPP